MTGAITKAQVPKPLVKGPLPQQIKNVIAVGSGKGGVGKTTVSVNVALALAQAGAKVGLMDADVYGPNVPIMVGLTRFRGLTDGQRLLPAERFGIQIVSMGFFIDEREPVVWRGPLLHKAVQQFLHGVAWGELDYLIVDMPPGTGDVQLSLCQLIPLAGAVIVTTPQEVALVDVVKAIRMFEQVNVPILGIVENMSWFKCPHCHKVTDIFGQGGGERLANAFHTVLLGRIGMDLRIREGGDQGQPIVVAYPHSQEAEAFRHAAEQLAARISVANLTAAKPSHALVV